MLSCSEQLQRIRKQEKGIVILLFISLVAIYIFWPVTHHHNWIQFKRVKVKTTQPILKGTASLELHSSWALPGSWTAKQRTPTGLLQGNGIEVFLYLCLVSQVVLVLCCNKGAGIRKSISSQRGSLVSGQILQECFEMSTTGWFGEVTKISLRM